MKPGCRSQKERERFIAPEHCGSGLARHASVCKSAKAQLRGARPVCFEGMFIRYTEKTFRKLRAVAKQAQQSFQEKRSPTNRNQNRICPQNTPINADTENEFFVCVLLRVLRAKAFSLIPCLHQEKSSPLCVILPECSAACCPLICQSNRRNI
jgi:hypothetical protein